MLELNFFKGHGFAKVIGDVLASSSPGAVWTPNIIHEGTPWNIQVNIYILLVLIYITYMSYDYILL